MNSFFEGNRYFCEHHRTSSRLKFWPLFTCKSLVLFPFTENSYASWNRRCILKEEYASPVSSWSNSWVRKLFTNNSPWYTTLDKTHDPYVDVYTVLRMKNFELSFLLIFYLLLHYNYEGYSFYFVLFLYLDFSLASRQNFFYQFLPERLFHCKLVFRLITLSLSLLVHSVPLSCKVL